MVFCVDERSFSNTQKSLEAQLYSQSLIFDLFFFFFKQTITSPVVMHLTCASTFVLDQSSFKQLRFQI